MPTIYVVSKVEDLWLRCKVWVLRRNASVGHDLGAVNTPKAVEPQETC